MQLNGHENGGRLSERAGAVALSPVGEDAILIFP